MHLQKQPTEHGQFLGERGTHHTKVHELTAAAKRRVKTDVGERRK